jgi:hypothetical protein
MIPNSSRPEWEKLITGELNPKLTSLSLQLKINALKLDIKLNRINKQEAILQLQTFCQTNESMVQKDLAIIFQ